MISTQHRDAFTLAFALTACGGSTLSPPPAPPPPQVPSVVIKQIAVGLETTCGVLEDGTVRCWGRNTRGELGNGTVGNCANGTCTVTPTVVVGLDHVTQVSTAFSHSCAVREQGDVWCWGANNNDQLADGTRIDRAVPVHALGLPADVVEVATGNESSCARTQAGDVWCWGLLDATGNDNGPRKLAISNAAQLGMGAVHSCVRLQNGGVECWGNLQCFTGQNVWQFAPVAIANLTDAVDLAVEGQGTIIARADGSLFLKMYACNDGIAALGAAVKDAVRVTGGDTACYLDRAGVGHCIGGGAGSLGDGTQNSQFGHFVTVIADKPLRQISAGEHTCAIDETGTASCCGDNSFGDLGDGTTIERNVLTPVRF